MFQILVVEDDLDIQEVLENHLCGSGYEVTLAGDGVEAVSLFAQKKYDLIVSNPPYFINSLKCPDNKRSVARHTDSLPLSELIENARALLSSAGRIALVLPYEQLEEVRETAQKNSLHICRQTNVIPVPGAHPKRLLVELSPVSTDTKKRNTLTIEEARHQYTPEYIALTKDFYLKM